MGLQLQSAITEARGVLNDTYAPYRYSDADLLQYANDALDAAVPLVPQYFYGWGEMTCTAGETMQMVSFEDAHALADTVRIKNGAALRPFDKAAMDAFRPDWHSDTAAPATQWARFGTDPIRFWIYPKAPVDQVLQVQYIKVPLEYTATADTGLPMTILPAITSYVVYMAEARDDEHVNSQRSALFMQDFLVKLKGG